MTIPHCGIILPSLVGQNLINKEGIKMNFGFASTRKSNLTIVAIIALMAICFAVFQSVDVYAATAKEIDVSVPEPATMFLLGSGLIVLAGFGRKKFKK